MLTDEKKKMIMKAGFFSIIIFLFVVVGIIILKYEVEGEKKLPFELKKINIVSNVDGIHSEKSEQYWNLNLIQNNDIYLNFEKNNNENTDSLIKKISLENINIISNPKKGNVNLYKIENNNMETNKKENKIENRIEYTGEIQSNMEQQKIGNQGGIVGLRCTIEDLEEFSSNDTEIRIDGKLLEKINVSKDDLIFKIGFDVNLELTSGIKYKAKVELELPCGNLIEDGICKKEITDLSNVIFKRT